MPDTTTTLLPILSLLASTAGAGYAASALFDALRRALPCPTPAQWRSASPLARLWWRALYSPRGARLTVFTLAAVIALVASVLTAALSGRDAFAAADAAMAVVVSQLIHAAGLTGRPAMQESNK